MTISQDEQIYRGSTNGVPFLAIGDGVTDLEDLPRFLPEGLNGEITLGKKWVGDWKKCTIIAQAPSTAFPTQLTANAEAVGSKVIVPADGYVSFRATLDGPIGKGAVNISITVDDAYLYSDTWRTSADGSAWYVWKSVLIPVEQGSVIDIRLWTDTTQSVKWYVPARLDFFPLSTK